MKIFLALLFFSSPSAFALSYEIVGACEERPLYQGQHPAGAASAGAATIEILEKLGLPFQGSEGGINSILHTPVGDEALEILSDTEMRAYGWCFEVDGLQPDVMPDKIPLRGSERLRWFYAFSHYKAGEWVSYCEPAYLVRPASLCPSGTKP